MNLFDLLEVKCCVQGIYDESGYLGNVIKCSFFPVVTFFVSIMSLKLRNPGTIPETTQDSGILMCLSCRAYLKRVI